MTDAIAFGLLEVLGTWNKLFSELDSRGSPARGPTHWSTASLPGPPQGSLPTGRARPWSYGDCTRWTTIQNFTRSSSTSFLSDQPFFLVATEHLQLKAWCAGGRDIGLTHLLMSSKQRPEAC